MSRAERFEPLDDEQAARWAKFGTWDRTYFMNLVGMEVEEIRRDYCRIRMPIRPELLQAGGVVHGGAIASLLDTVVVPAVGGPLPAGAAFSTVDMHVQFMGALVERDAVAEGWVTRRGKRTVFCESEIVEDGTDRLIARSVLTYSVRA